MCECNNFPIPHHAGWCALEAHPVSDKAWNEFERLTVSQWAGH